MNTPITETKLKQLARAVAQLVYDDLTATTDTDQISATRAACAAGDKAAQAIEQDLNAWRENAPDWVTAKPAAERRDDTDLSWLPNRGAGIDAKLARMKTLTDKEAK